MACILEPRKRLEANVKRMLTEADNREPLSLDYPELAPIAQALRQLTLNHRLRQKRACPRLWHEPMKRKKCQESNPERIHQTPWAVTMGSW